MPFSVDQELSARTRRSRRAFGTHSQVARSLSQQGQPCAAWAALFSVTTAALICWLPR